MKWGIIGAGKIAQKFAEDLILTEGQELCAIASRSLQKAQDFADRNGITQAFGDYASLIESFDLVDIIYIATPHHIHAELSIKAMQAGKHVLCEKPACVNAKDMQEVLQCSRIHQRFFMEGLWTRFNPSMIKLLEIIRSGYIGEIRYVNADFCFPAHQNEKSRLFNLELAGGALLDIGIYPLFLAYSVLGSPLSLNASANFSSTGVDKQLAMTLNYVNAHAVLYASFDVLSPMDARIHGSEGSIVIKGRWHETGGFTVIKDGLKEDFDFPVSGNGFVPEILECEICISDSRIESAMWRHDDSLRLCEIMDSVREHIGLKYPFE